MVLRFMYDCWLAALDAVLGECLGRVRTIRQRRRRLEQLKREAAAESVSEIDYDLLKDESER